MTVDDILHFLVSNGTTPSNLGTQLERLKLGITHTEVDPFLAKESAENAIMQLAAILRVISSLENSKSVPTTLKTLTRISERTKTPPGVIAIRLLKAYQEFSYKSAEQALVRVYRSLTALDSSLAPPLPDNPAQAFREGLYKRARLLASEAYADSLLALHHHMRRK